MADVVPEVHLSIVYCIISLFEWTYDQIPGIIKPFRERKWFWPPVLDLHHFPPILTSTPRRSAHSWSPRSVLLAHPSLRPKLFSSPPPLVDVQGSVLRSDLVPGKPSPAAVILTLSWTRVLSTMTQPAPYCRSMPSHDLVCWTNRRCQQLQRAKETISTFSFNNDPRLAVS